MTQEEQQPQRIETISYLKYKSLEDLLKIILYSSQSPLGALPMLYYICHNSQHLFFIQTGGLGITTVHYHMENEKPGKKFIELKRLSGEFRSVDKIGTESMSLYIPILELEKTSFDFL